MSVPAITSSASSPDDAVRTSYPRGVRIASRSLMLGGWSSTTSTLGSCGPGSVTSCPPV